MEDSPSVKLGVVIWLCVLNGVTRHEKRHRKSARLQTMEAAMCNYVIYDAILQCIICTYCATRQQIKDELLAIELAAKVSKFLNQHEKCMNEFAEQRESDSQYILKHGR